MTIQLPITDRQIEGELVKTSNGRDIYRELGITKDYSSWAKAQIKRGRLLEDRDFVKLTQKGELSATGQTLTEYFFTLEAGKHIGMMSNTQRGFEVREYFIERERVANGKPARPAIPYSVGKQDTLTIDEQDELRNILSDGAQALPLKERGPFLTRGWSKLKAHFKTPYREIPRNEFTEALSIASRHVNDLKPVALPAPTDTALHQAIDSMHLMAGSVADLAAAVIVLTQAAHAREAPRTPKKLEARPAPTGRASSEKSTAPTVHVSLTQNP